MCLGKKIEYQQPVKLKTAISPYQGFFLRLLKAKKYLKNSLLQKYKNSQNLSDQKAKCQPWIIKKCQNLNEKAQIG
jgi:hypothetical protein